MGWGESKMIPELLAQFSATEARHRTAAVLSLKGWVLESLGPNSNPKSAPSSCHLMAVFTCVSGD